MIPPKSDAAPGGTEACVRVQTIHPEYIDFLLVMAIRGLLFPKARALADRLGPDLFPKGPARFLAGALIVDPAPRVGGLSPQDRAILDNLLAYVERATIPDTDAWAVHIIGVLSERQYAPILAGTLRWAAAETEHGAPVGWLRQRVTNALDIAEGVRPFDSTATWGERAA